MASLEVASHATSDSEDTPLVGAVVSTRSTSGAHHDCRVVFEVRDDIRKEDAVDVRSADTRLQSDHVK